MSTPPPNPTELPIEIIEQILLCLSGQDIIKMEAVNRHFRNLIFNSPTVHHRRELFAAGLIDNPCCPCDFAERRKLCEAYTYKWSKAVDIAKNTREIPPSLSLGWSNANHLGNGYLVSDSEGRRGLAFLHIPPIASQESVEGWNIPPFSFDILGYAVYPPANVLAVTERGTDMVRIHIVNLQGSSPYHPSPSNIITCKLPPGVFFIFNHKIAMTGSRIMAFGSYMDLDSQNYRKIWRVDVWDWETGDSVLNLSSTDGRVGQKTQVVFLDEFRMAVIPDGISITELIVFNTLVPQDDPGNIRQLGLPRKFHELAAKIHVDHGRPLGMPNGDEPLVADPAQAVLVIELTEGLESPVFLVVKTRTLIEQACSTCADSYVPWDEWGRDAVVMDVPAPHGNPSVFVHGAWVVVVRKYASDRWDRPWQYIVQKVDFSLRGCSFLPVWGGGGGTEKRVLLEDEGCFILDLSDGVRLSRLESLSDGSLFYLWMGVRDGSDVALRVLELV